ncbi:hypothetical protein MHK_005199, partial [Candidatus Magnetomorum sp. HK-1]
YIPDNETLLNLYDLYLKYFFLSQTLIKSHNKQSSNPAEDAKVKILLSRLSILSKKVSGPTKMYEFYKNEATQAGGDTRFLPFLFLARKGHLMMRQIKFSFPRKQIFEYYMNYFDQALNFIKSNISYRCVIYNELILLGMEVNNLSLMETKLYP